MPNSIKPTPAPVKLVTESPAPTKPQKAAAPAKAAPKQTAEVKAKTAVAAKKAAPKVAPKTTPKTATKTTTKAAAKQPAKKPVAPAQVAVVKPPKLVRDSFTMPADEYAGIATLKARLLVAGRTSKKSELLRFALVVLGTMNTPELCAGLDALPVLKVGRRKGK